MSVCKTFHLNFQQVDSMIHDFERSLKLTVEHNPDGISSPEDQSCLLDEAADKPGTLDFLPPHKHGVRQRSKHIV